MRGALTPPLTRRLACATALAALLAVLTPALARAASKAFIAPFIPNPAPMATTVPANGDVNPYGIVTVPRSIGKLHAGDLLISNFNDFANLQGTGTTIVQLPPGGGSLTPGTASEFAQIDPNALPGPCSGGVGLTTALAVTRSGFVIVGSLPTANGLSATAKAGCLIVLDDHGKVVETIKGDHIDGPWDMTAVDDGATTTLYVTNVLNDTVANSPNVVDRGTVVRLELSTVTGQVPQVLSDTVIANGLPERTDPAALVIGPTGDALGSDGTLYVADTLDDRIAAIPDAASRQTPMTYGETVTMGGALNGPLGMALAPNGDILTANGGDGRIVETTPAGKQIAVKEADRAGGAGVLFGIAVPPGVDGIDFVDDGDNTLRLLTN